jgi:hypothetical protein
VSPAYEPAGAAAPILRLSKSYWPDVESRETPQPLSPLVTGVRLARERRLGATGKEVLPTTEQATRQDSGANTKITTRKVRNLLSLNVVRTRSSFDFRLQNPGLIVSKW